MSTHFDRLTVCDVCDALLYAFQITMQSFEMERPKKSELWLKPGTQDSKKAKRAQIPALVGCLVCVALGKKRAGNKFEEESKKNAMQPVQQSFQCSGLRCHKRRRKKIRRIDP